MRVRLLALLTALFGCVTGGELQATNLLVNGDFEMVTMTNGNALHSTIFGHGLDNAAVGPTLKNLPTVTGWTTRGYNFVFVDNPSYNGGSPVTQTGADDFGSGACLYGNCDPGARLSLWGPDIGTNNGLTNSPTGGNFVGADGAYGNAPIEQTISGLEVGKVYKLTFWWAAAQQTTYDGATQDRWQVCFGVCDYSISPDAPIFLDYRDGHSTYNLAPGDQLLSTGTVNNASHGFVPWQFETMYFTANDTTQKLSLLAYGLPTGQPPFALIDGLNLEAIPEPSTWAMMLIGFGLVGGIMRSNRRSPVCREVIRAQIV
ncbi:PEPxxWA-CTERM sorting domain-containing protein [Rhizorhabdus wittichii]|uniref:Ice-binding protein C-terminal domain-containing protein n=2 Tax=Rhizorhabdus wittichii TaxID=160791 RepID=A0A9J9H9K3_RHIWR|nr:PEPxxWA-CTERM sorting domain-containing protein [Rhizorhabdus wittichii]ABQ67500.1 hypothetical protein Swit_1134 [Rhizorhabdus wittichii RW1]ARR55727.1 PEP-CTERM sorting domain-containing protein [Rhizorhabdus wittichii DC-6]